MNAPGETGLYMMCSLMPLSRRLKFCPAGAFPSSVTGIVQSDGLWWKVLLPSPEIMNTLPFAQENPS